MAPFVVCSRTVEYETATSRHRLALQEAVVVSPLTHEQVDAYLVQAGKPLTALRSALKKNVALYDLATTPLMLNILILTYQGKAVRGLSSRQSLLLQEVWDDYIQRMVERKGNGKRYPPPLTRAWLSYLARQMRDHNQTVFYLEHLQPDWLTASQQRTYTSRAVRLPAIFIGVLVGILVSLFSSYLFSSYSFFSGGTNLSWLLQNAVLGGLLGELWYGSVLEKGNRKEHHHMQRKRLVKRLVISTCIGLIYGLSFGFYYLSPYSYYTLHDWLIDGISSSVVMGFSSLLLQYLLTTPFHLRESLENGVPRLWQRVVHFWSAAQGPRALLVAVITGLSYGLSFGLGYGLNVGLGYGLNYGLRYGLSFGVGYGLISLTLGVQMGGIYLTERMRLTGRNLRKGLFNFRHLRITVLLTCISILFIGLSYALDQGLSTTPSKKGLEFREREIILDALHKPSETPFTIDLLLLGVVLSDSLPSGLGSSLRTGLYIGISSGRSDALSREENNSQHRIVSLGDFEVDSPASTWLSYTLNYVLGIEHNIGLSGRQTNELNYGLSYGLGIGLSVGVSYWFLVGLSQGIPQEQIEDQDRRIVNQGIHRSFRNSVIMGITGGAMIGSIGILSQVLSYGLSQELSSVLGGDLSSSLGDRLNSQLNYWLNNYGLSLGLLISISGALLIYILTGGLTAWRHYAIRFLLWHSRSFPWTVSQFLDDATARFLLRRIGGGYSFSHRLLLDHLADAKTGATPSPNASSTQLPHP